MSRLSTHIINTIIATEAGFVDDPNDSGGKTRWGITKAVARANGYKGKMRKLPRETAFRIYKHRYWDALSLDAIELLSPRIAEEVADTSVNMGVSVAGRFLQRALNVLNRRGRDYHDIRVDGKVGRLTVKALRAYLRKRGKEGETVLYRMLNALQGARYVKLAERYEKNEEFEHGWFANRVGMA